uniref:Uncharacterized protein n=1 Tax=Oryza meridionalis TaxID=40149 RepID=A0A0E0DKB6_9ORYZ
MADFVTVAMPTALATEQIIDAAGADADKKLRRALVGGGARPRPFQVAGRRVRPQQGALRRLLRGPARRCRVRRGGGGRRLLALCFPERPAARSREAGRMVLRRANRCRRQTWRFRRAQVINPAADELVACLFLPV